MTPLVQARISYAIKLVGILVAVGSVIGAAWTALNTTGIFTPVTIALFILFSLVALITALQEFIKADPLTEIIPGDAGVQAQATVTATLDEVHQLLLEIKGVVTSLPQPQASVSITTPASATGTESTTITATAGDVSTPASGGVQTFEGSGTGMAHTTVPADPATSATWGAVETSTPALPIAESPVDAPAPIVGDVGQNTTPATPSPVDVPQPVTSGDVAQSGVADAPMRFVTDAEGNRYQLVPASSVL